MAVAGEPPDDRAQDPAAVEREGGHDVQQEHEGVRDRGEAQDDRDQRAGVEAQRRGVGELIAGQRIAERAEDQRQHERHDGAGGGDAELLARRDAVAVGAHEAAEEEQVDADHADPLAPRGERVPELVGDDRAEEQRRGEHRGDEAVAVAGDRRLERVAQDDDPEEQDDEPRRVRADAEPEDPRQGDGGAAAEHVT
jgi:hypothetical protein